MGVLLVRPRGNETTYRVVCNAECLDWEQAEIAGECSLTRLWAYRAWGAADQTGFEHPWPLETALTTWKYLLLLFAAFNIFSAFSTKKEKKVDALKCFKDGWGS